MRWRAQIFFGNEGAASGEKVVKSGCLKKRLQWRAPIFCRNEGEI